MTDATAHFDAGGLVPVGVSLPADRPADVVDARRYAHPAAPGRVMIRLVPQALAEGVDTELGLLGFHVAGTTTGVAQTRRRTLGFPGWALVNDPARARYALDVMQQFKVHAKKIASKPGHARDGFQEVADGLQRKVPHFLPSFWEEAGRAFLVAGNVAYATTAFDKARAAEREFGLTVDEEHRAGVFLEFALQSALSVKSLQAYGKDLQANLGPAAAYARFYDLAVKRTLGGMPPWASLPKDLRALAKAAKLDVAAEDRRFVGEVLGGSALQRAPASFWVEYADAVAALARSPEARARLLDLFPTGGKRRYWWRDEDDGFTDAWMGVLAKTGALVAIWDPTAPEAARPAGGRAAWFYRFQEWLPPGSGWALQVARRAASTLAAEGAPIKVRSGDYGRPLDLDLLELLAQLGLRYELDGHPRVDFEKWSAGASVPARDGFEAAARPLDLVHVAQDPALVPFLAAAVDGVFGNADFERVVGGQVGLRTIRDQWLATVVGDVDRAGIAAAAWAVERLEEATGAEVFAEFPERLAELQQRDVAVALANTLREGILDELGWPAWDAAVADLAGATGAEAYTEVLQWPWVLVATPLRAWVLGPDGGTKLDLKQPKDVTPRRLVWVGGRLLVGWSGYAKGGYQQRGYWSHKPNDAFDVDVGWGGDKTFPVSRGDHVVFGEERVGVGDRKFPSAATLFHDAGGAWMLHDAQLVRFDVDTGKPGAPGAPGFLSDVPPGLVGISRYYPVPASIAADSPLGCVDGQYGAKRLGADADTDEIEDDEPARSTDVRLVTLAGDVHTGMVRRGFGQLAPSVLVRLPGHDTPRVAVEIDAWNGRTVGLASPASGVVSSVIEDAGDLTSARLPPLDAWHYLRPRDRVGSAALRAATPALAQALLDRLGPDVEIEAAERVVAEVLPAITDARLRRGVARDAVEAAALSARLSALKAERKGGKVGTRPADVIPDAAATDAFAPLRHYYAYGSGSVSAAIHDLGQALVHGQVRAELASSRLDPYEWIGRIRALGWLATRPGGTAEQARVVHRVLRAWLASGLADDAMYRVGTVRIDTLAPWVKTETNDGHKAPVEAWVVVDGAHTAWVHTMDTDDEGPWSGQIIERSTDGTWLPLPGATVDAKVYDTRGDRAWIEALLAEAERPARSLDRPRLERFAAATGQPIEQAAHVLATFPPTFDAGLRDALGLKATPLKAVVGSLPGFEERMSVLAEGAPADPTALWGDPDGALATAWVARFGRPVPVSADLIAAAAKELPWSAREAPGKFADAARWAAIQHDARWEIDAEGDLVRAGDDDGEGFEGSTIAEVVQAVAWLADRLPVGDPLLAQVPAVVAAVRKRLENPDLWFDAGGWWVGTPKEKKAARAFFDALGGEAVVAQTDEDSGDPTRWVRRSGPLAASRGSDDDLQLYYRPAALDPHSREIVNRYHAASADEDGEADEGLLAWDLLRSDDFVALVERIAHSPLPAGAWEQDPRASAPDVVAAVAKAKKLSSDAATLYLQTLALLDPNKKRICEVNGWTPKVYGAAVAELVDAKLVLEAKRSRAGREHFLPGGWAEPRFGPPHEEWKRPLYGWKDDDYALGRPYLLAPHATLFARAWDRCRAAPPRFEEVRR